MGLASGVHAQTGTDITTLSLEQLVNVDVYSASKFHQRSADAPASVSVVTREDIRVHGHRSLADIIRSVRGMYAYYDRFYEYVGVRGFARPGDYSSRVLLLIDGYRTNDNVYDSALIGTDSLVDVDLIERVEFVRGPSSSLYGGNAFFGVINVITRKPSNMPTGELSGTVGTARTHAGRMSFAKTLENGAEFLISAGKYRQRGKDLYFQEFDTPTNNDGHARGVDYDRNGRVYGSFSFSGLTLTAGQVARTKGVGNGYLGADFGDPRNYGTDTSAFVDAAYGATLTDKLDLSLRLSYGDYRYRGDLFYSGVTNRYEVDGRWWSGEAKLVTTLSTRHRIVAGLEYQQNTKQDQRTFDIDPSASYMDDRRRSNREGFYVQDDYTWTDALTTTVGLRHDRLATGTTVTSPRLAVVWRISSATTFKSMYGTAFRAPNVYEAYASFPSSAITNPNLRPERIRSLDIVLEHYLNKDTRAVVNGYVYRINDLISQVTESNSGLLQFQNVDSVRARGLEFELERTLWRGARLRSSVATQTNEDSTGTRLPNSPRQIVKAALITPTPIEQWKLGTEVQYLGGRRSAEGNPVGGYSVANINLLRDPGRKFGWEWSIGVYNLLSRRYHDPVNIDPSVPGRDRMQQDGRSARLVVKYSF